MTYFGGWLDDLLGTAQNIIERLGLDPAVAEAVAVAYASPSIANIRAVESAYASIGGSPPAELMSTLWNRYYETVPQAVYQRAVTDVLPWGALILGGLLIFAVARSSKSKG